VLDELEASVPATSRRLRPRIKRLLSLALLTTVSARDLERHPTLRRLCSPEIARGFHYAEMLARMPMYDNGESDEAIDYIFGRHRPPTPNETALSRLRELGGFMVPAAIQLTEDPRPVARAYGVALLASIPPASESLEKLRQDRAVVSTLDGDLFGHETIANMAFPPRPPTSGEGRVAYRFERVLAQMDLVNHAYDGMYDLTNGIRSTSNAMEATTWDEWWDETRPAWNQWWRLAGQGLRPRDRWDWLNYLFEFEGRHFRVRPSPQLVAELRVYGPRGTSVEIFQDSVRVASGTVPLRFVREVPLGGDPADREVQGLAVRAELPEGQRREIYFAGNRGEIWTLTFLDWQRRRP
jgi:hypothetical protein